MNNIALIDGDLIVHEIAVLGEYYDEEDVDKEHLIYKNFMSLENIIEDRIEEIRVAARCGSVELYLTGKNNFRYDVAKKKPYKGNRTGEKPFHYDNVRWYIISRYNAIIADGMEADDALAIRQTGDISFWNSLGYDEFKKTEYPSTVICTRDKDLRQVPGWHYGWEVGNQPEYSLRFVDEIGSLESTWKEVVSEKTGKESLVLKKVAGTGLKWFYAQCLIGDSTDNIPGLPKCGPKKALDLLEECTTEQEMFLAVAYAYAEVYGEDSLSELTEQARLVWMVRELNEDGSPKMWELPMTGEELKCI